MGIISWLIFGAIAGWLASMLAGENAEQGWLANIAVGVVGAVIGGFIYGLFGGDGFEFGWSIGSFIVAVGGALVLLFGLRLIRRRA